MKNLEDIINKVHCADSLEFLKEMPNNCVDLIITDPPYGLNYRSHRPVASAQKDFIVNDKPQDLVPLINDFIPEMVRVMKPDSEIYWFCGGGGSPILAWAWLAFKELEPLIRVKNLLVWDKGYVGLGWDWRFQYETIFQLVKGKGIDNSDTSASNVIKARKIIPQEGEHPTPKSEEVIWELMKRKSKEGDLILDPFNGGGATTFTAYNHKRNFIGIDIEPKYVEMAQKRLQQQILNF